MDERAKKSDGAFWTTVVVLLPVLYVASFGPACWMTSYVGADGAVVNRIYRPLMRARWGPGRPEGLQLGCRFSRPEEETTLLYRYGSLFVHSDWRFDDYGGWHLVNQAPMKREMEKLFEKMRDAADAKAEQNEAGLE